MRSTPTPTAQPRRTVTLHAQRYQNTPAAIERQVRALTQDAPTVDYGRWWCKTFLPGRPVHRWVEWQVAWVRSQPGWLYCRELSPRQQTLLLVTDPTLATAAAVARLFQQVEQQPFCLELAGNQQWSLLNAVAWPMVSCLRGVRVPAYRLPPPSAR